MQRRFLNNKIDISLIGIEVMVYTGREWVSILVDKTMVGAHFSDFIFSKKEGFLIHKVIDLKK